MEPKRWDTGAVIHEGDGTIADLVAATQKLWISKFRANLREANLREANLSIYSRWTVSYKLEPLLVVSSGCKSMSIPDWDAWFAGSEVFDTHRDDERFLRIRANYLAIRVYLVALGHHMDLP